MVFPRTLCDDISSSDYGATDKASFSFSFSFLCLATAITGLAFIFLVIAVAFPWPWPGLLVFFRVYLDRRKLQADDSDTLKVIKNLLGSETPAFGALRIDRESVDVDENEEWISVPGVEQRIGKSSSVTKGPLPPPRLATAPPNRRPSQPRDEAPKMQGKSYFRTAEKALHC
ncbi:hypothetical protein AVEN_16628-1 [Araneus ventricosus]|uniref:Uncharacterized protein n=1 Tax=Araneus ventricosus TaxID=182803 RepID=A0A4Y2BD18_ARAVE|nr:hypothetical protein AVEN_16628-1 [Araneus ventricosus]